MTLPVQPAPHIASGRCISLGVDNLASPRAYPKDLVYDFAGIEIQNKALQAFVWVPSRFLPFVRGTTLSLPFVRGGEEG